MSTLCSVGFPSERMSVTSIQVGLATIRQSDSSQRDLTRYRTVVIRGPSLQAKLIVDGRIESYESDQWLTVSLCRCEAVVVGLR